MFFACPRQLATQRQPLQACCHASPLVSVLKFWRITCKANFSSLLVCSHIGEKLDLLPEKEEILVSCGVTTKQAILLCTSANKLYFAELNRSVELIQFETTPLVMVSKEYRESGVQLVAVSFQYDDADNSRLFECKHTSQLWSGLTYLLFLSQ